MRLTFYMNNLSSISYKLCRQILHTVTFDIQSYNIRKKFSDVRFFALSKTLLITRLGSCSPLIQLWQLEELLLQRDTYVNQSRTLSTASAGWNHQGHLSSFRPKNVARRISSTLRYLALENWQRGWMLLLWATVMACLFCWKFYQYSHKNAFLVMGYCRPVAKGAAETLKLNMALVLLPVCRNTLTWLRSTRARSFIPFDDNINFHKVTLTPIITNSI